MDQDQRDRLEELKAKEAQGANNLTPQERQELDRLQQQESQNQGSESGDRNPKR